MLIEKEIIAPGTYWYTDEATGLPRRLDVTPELTRYWYDRGGEMLSAGLTIPVPYEHDFSAHPMTPKEKLLNNAGWVKEYRLKDHKLFGVVDVQDEEVAKKLPRTIRWTSPWINSFTDGQGREWKNVISHLALTTRPRITKQEPFGSVAAALSMATETRVDAASLVVPTGAGGFCLSRAGRLFTGKKSKRLQPRYPLAFSMWGGVKLSDDDMPFKKKDKSKPDKGGNDQDDDLPDGEGGDDDFDMSGLMDPMKDAGGDVQMEELLCDLLQALGVPMPDESNEQEFKRHLYEAVMSKIKELTSHGMGKQQQMNKPDQNKPPNQQPNASQPKQNPLIQQEQQPMYMSLTTMTLEEINALPDPMRTVALSMYADNQRLQAELDSQKKVTDSLREAKLREAAAQRQARIALLSRMSPKLKTDLEAMVAAPGMALSMGEGGAVVDPMEQTLRMLEKGLADMPRLLTTEQSALSVQSQPTDGGMSEEEVDRLADDFARWGGGGGHQDEGEA